MQTKLEYGQQLLDIEIEYSARKQLSITVNPEKKVTVKAPIGCEESKIQACIRKRTPWIVRQLDYFDLFHPLQPERRFVSGETHYYLGRQYRLRIRAAKQGVEKVRLIGGFFVMELEEPSDTQKAKKMMLGWYTRHAKSLMERHSQKYLSYFLELGAITPQIKYRRMKKRWGSCSPQGVITLNTDLVKAPLQCIDYVIVHEFCHLLYRDHNQKFYRLLAGVFPDWEKRKARLERANI